MDKPEELNMKLMLFGALLIVLVLAASVILFFVIYQKRLLADQARLQYVQSEYQRRLLASSIDAQEQERARISQDLHDEIGSSLSAVKLLLNQVAARDGTGGRMLSQAGDILTHSIQNVRNISFNLHPSVLSKFGLADALQHLVSVLSDAASLRIEYAAEPVAGLDYNQELALYRIVQELLNNVIRHAGADTIRLSLQQGPYDLTLTVSDNGRGFDYAAVRSSPASGIGYKSIEARTAMLQAEIDVRTAAGAGTEATLIIPVGNPQTQPL